MGSVPPVRLINIAVEGQIENALTSQLGHPINIFSNLIRRRGPDFDITDSQINAKAKKNE